MAKTKETKVAVRGEDPKKASKASRTARKVPPQLSEVNVVSDSSSSDSASNSGSESESEAEKKKSTKKPKISKVKKSVPNNPPVPDDTSDDDSEDDSSSEGDVAKMLKQAKVVKKNASAAVSANGAVAKAASSSEESSEDEDDSEGESASDKAADVDEEMADAPVAAPAPVDPTRAVAPQPFNPPSGFKPLDTKNASSATLTSLLSNPSGKQIWHITAPSSVPLTQIQNISLAHIQKQSSVLTHEATSYTLAEEKESKTTKKVLVPGQKGYQAVELPVSKSLVLQQIISLPNLPVHSEKEVDNGATPVLQRGKREPRPQPKGLRMRYKPLGHVDGQPAAVLGVDESDEDDDVEMSETVSFKAPKGLQTEKEKKRKRVEEAAAAPRTEKKRRKEKESKRKSGNENTLEEDTLEVLEGHEEEAKKLEEKLAEGTQKEVPQTEEEIARKKAERKEKKKSKEKKK